MLRTPRATLRLLVLLALAASSSSAAPLVSYQGLLSDDLGDPIDGVVDLVFTLYDDELAGSVVWSESHSAQPVVDGEFNVLLGSVSPLDPAYFDDPDLWLEFEVDGETLAPRQRITSVPFALRAGCNPGDFLGCYSGDPATLDVGECSAGVRTCGSDGRWGACVGESSPTPEVCANGLDEDCNGAADDGCSLCGNGVVDGGEDCDYALPGSCEAFCADGITCTLDIPLDPLSCSPACSNPIAPGMCFIGGTCYGSGFPNPSNSCEECNPAASPTSWAAVTDGTPCAGGSCQVGTCVASGAPDGSACGLPADCQSLHCQNGYCCASGDCCSTALDCPGGYYQPPACNDASTCQGTRQDAVCTGASQCAMSGPIDDDSACGGLLALTCGFYADEYCSGATSTPPPVCATACSGDEDCDPVAHCDANACVPD